MKTGRKVATSEEFSVAKGENLVANATNTVAMSSPACRCRSHNFPFSFLSSSSFHQMGPWPFQLSSRLSFLQLCVPSLLIRMKVNDHRSQYIVFITKPAGEQLTCGSKSLSFNWFLFFKVNKLPAYIIIFHKLLKIV